MCDKVWMLSISHRHGEEISLYKTEKGAKDALYEYVKEWWTDTVFYNKAGIDKPPKNKQKAIEEYFAPENWYEPEYYTIEERNVE